ncbi:MAG: pseudaminic acid synthase [Candidatus Pacebacteria bacterium]|nr:pseudaminic acid synthase [Candidatus Paceibacterota bacterium]
MKKEFKIGDRMVGDGHPALIIAELSANHLQNLERAKELVRIACNAGADVIKVQTYTPDTMTLNSDKEPFQVNVNEAWKGQTLHSLYQKAHTPWEWYRDLGEITKENKAIFIGTPYEATSIDFLEKMNCPFYKIASFEATDIEFLKKAAQTKKPIVISRGMTTFSELSQAIAVLKSNGAKDIAILHCVSAYPTKIENLNLLTIPEIQNKFPDVVVGLSDHSLSIVSGAVGVALGAKIIERHFILNRSDGGPDATFSLEAQEFSLMVQEAREAEKMLGKPFLETAQSEKENKQFRRSLWVIKDIKAGEEFTKENIGSFRPAVGLEPKYFEEILGKKAKKDIEFGTPLTRELVK